MSSFIIIILAIILLALIILNNIKIVSTGTSSTANCTQTTFGCCPNGVDSKINFYGTNCPAYNPGPGYLPGPGPPGPPGHSGPSRPGKIFQHLEDTFFWDSRYLWHLLNKLVNYNLDKL